MAFTVTTGANSGGVTTGTVSVAVPGGSSASGDLLIAVFESQTASPGPNATGWTHLQSTQVTGLSGTTRLTIALLLATGNVGATVAFTCPTTNNHTSGQMMKITGHGVTAMTDIVADGSTAGGTPTFSTGATGVSVSGVTGLTVVNGSLIVFCVGDALDATSTAQFSAWSATGVGTWTEIFDNLVITGNGGGIGCAYATSTGTTIGTGSVTRATNTDAWNAMMLGIPPAGGGPVTVTPGAAIGLGSTLAPTPTATVAVSASLGLGSAPAPLAKDTVTPTAALGLGQTAAPTPAAVVFPTAALGLGSTPAPTAGSGGTPVTANAGVAIGLGSTMQPTIRVNALPTAALGLGSTPAPTPRIVVPLTAAVGLGSAPTPSAAPRATPTAALCLGSAPAPALRVLVTTTAATGIGSTPTAIAMVETPLVAFLPPFRSRNVGNMRSVNASGIRAHNIGNVSSEESGVVTSEQAGKIRVENE